MYKHKHFLDYYFLLIAAVLFAAVCLYANTAVAADIGVRVGQHDDYDRVVFDWKRSVQYEAKNLPGGGFEISFRSSDKPNLSAITRGVLQFFNDIDLVESGAGQQKVVFDGPQDTNYRHFRLGSKVVVDVSGQKLRTVAVKKRAPKRTAAKKEEPKKLIKKQPVKIKKEQKYKESSTLTISSTSTFGLAVFRHNGALWLVSDQPAMAIPPQVQGNAAKWIGDAQRFDVNGGTVFRYTWPADKEDTFFIEPEGGGLLWRLRISDFKHGLETSGLRSFVSSDKTHGLYSEMPNSREVITFKDPLSGQNISTVTVSNAQSRLKINRGFVNFDVKEAVVGAAIIEKIPSVKLTIREPRARGFEISGEPGLIFSQNSKDLYESIVSDLSYKLTENSDRIYYLSRWAGEGKESLENARQDFERHLSVLKTSDPDFVEFILSLAKLHLANYMPHEALGYFNYAGRALREIEEGEEFLSLRAAARALAGQNRLAQQDFQNKILKDLPEIQYWLGYNYGRLEDWDKAYEYAPKDPVFIANYPSQVKHELAVIIAEAALRAKDLEMANNYLGLLKEDLTYLKNPYLSSYRYLLGEARRQEGDIAGALDLWEALMDEGDKLYRAKAGLAWAMLASLEDKIQPDGVIDILDRLRYTWRGDGLETQIGHRLGLAYLKNKEYKKGLSLLREIASFTQNDFDRSAIVSDMQDSFKSLFVGDNSKDLSPIQALTLYEAFSELLPSGREGDQIVGALVDKLIEVDLIGRASDLLEHSIAHRLSGFERAKATLKLARLKLIDNKPDATLDTLKKVSQTMLSRSSSLNKEKVLLEVKALAERGDTNRALSTLAQLGNTAEADQVKADIAWKKGEWNDAANALLSLLAKKGINEAKPALDPSEAQLVLNTAVALNLSGDIGGLEVLQTKFMRKMEKTDLDRLFKIVTRPPGQSYLVSRETLTGIVSEVDLFDDVLKELE